MFQCHDNIGRSPIARMIRQGEGNAMARIKFSNRTRTNTIDAVQTYTTNDQSLLAQLDLDRSITLLTSPDHNNDGHGRLSHIGQAGNFALQSKEYFYEENAHRCGEPQRSSLGNRQ